MSDQVAVEIYKQHLIANEDGAVLLIDTGSPSSFGRRSVQWRGKTLDLQSGLAIYPLADISKSIGIELDGLLGADVLLQEALTLDLAGGSMAWGQWDHLEEPSLPLSSMLGVPLAMVAPDLPCAVDTGAVRTYLASEIGDGMERVGVVQDFYPGLGPFESEQVQIQVMVGGAYHQLEVGLLPEMLEGLLTMFQIQGIIGLDILSKQRACIDLESERLWPHVGMKLDVAV